MMIEQHFPLGIAEGKSFLGREKEIHQLKHNISHGTHTLLISPRRYGKTSLVKHVIASMLYPSIDIDLFICQDESAIEQKFLKGIQKMINQLDKPEKWFHPLVEFFKKSKKVWSVAIKGFKLEIIPEDHQDVAENILEGLTALEYILSRHKNSKAVIFIDEFQEIANVKSNRAIEGAIRHFAQSSKHIVFIFSGSSQHLLKHMFDDKSRPLYALCDRIKLARLTPQEYLSYLNKVSKKTWKNNIPKPVFDRIMELTECHPRYVYFLCMKLWEYFSGEKNPPSVEQVDKTWQKLIQERLKDTREMLIKKAGGQIKVLTLIASGYTQAMTGKEAQRKLNMSGSAITQSVQNLEEEDYVDKSLEGRYFLIDPLLKHTLTQYGDMAAA